MIRFFLITAVLRPSPNSPLIKRRKKQVNRSDEGLTLETSVFFTPYGDQFTLSTQLFTLNYLLYSSTDAASQFLWKLTLFILLSKKLLRFDVKQVNRSTIDRKSIS